MRNPLGITPTPSIVRTKINLFIKEIVLAFVFAGAFFNDSSIASIHTLKSLKNSLVSAKNKFKNVDIKIVVIDDDSDDIIINKINQLLKKSNLNYKVEKLNKEEFKEFVEEKSDNDTFSNLSSLLKCFLATTNVSDSFN